MRTLIFAAIISLAIAQTVLWSDTSIFQEVNTTPWFDEAEKRGMTVSWGKMKTYYKSHYALSFLIMGGKVGLGVSKRTGNSILEDGNYVMQWYTHENPDVPGSY